MDIPQRFVVAPKTLVAFASLESKTTVRSPKTSFNFCAILPGMKNIIAYVLGSVGAILTLASSIFYTLFTGTVALKEFWIGSLLIFFAVVGACGVYIVHKKPSIGKKLLLLAGVGGIFTLLFLAGFGSSILMYEASMRATSLFFGGYVLFLVGVLFFRKES